MAEPEPLTPKEIRSTLEELFRYAVWVKRGDFVDGMKVEAAGVAAQIAGVLLSFPEPFGLEEDGTPDRGDAPPSEPE